MSTWSQGVTSLRCMVLDFGWKVYGRYKRLSGAVWEVGCRVWDVGCRM